MPTTPKNPAVAALEDALVGHIKGAGNFIKGVAGGVAELTSDERAKAAVAQAEKLAARRRLPPPTNLAPKSISDIPRAVWNYFNQSGEQEQANYQAGLRTFREAQQPVRKAINRAAEKEYQAADKTINAMPKTGTIGDVQSTITEAVPSIMLSGGRSTAGKIGRSVINTAQQAFNDYGKARSAAGVVPGIAANQGIKGLASAANNSWLANMAAANPKLKKLQQAAQVILPKLQGNSATANAVQPFIENALSSLSTPTQGQKLAARRAPTTP